MIYGLDPVMAMAAEESEDLTADQKQLAGDVVAVAEMADRLRADEWQAIKNIWRIMKRHPLGPWCQARPGVSDKQLARLLAAIGDPYWNDLHDRPRTVSELWAYCGLHVLHPGGQRGCDTQKTPAAGVAPRHMKGVQGNWNDTARTRAWLIAVQCMKTPTSTYRPVYKAAREKYADAVHQAACVRCGPRGKPAQPGSPLSLGHQHARALRFVAKRILRDLWRESKRLHEQQAAASGPDAHGSSAAACPNDWKETA